MPESFDKKILRFAGNKLLPIAVDVLCKTLRIEIENEKTISELTVNQQNFVVAFWHGKMALGWYLHSNKNFAALVSQSNDGQILTNVLNKWGFDVSRGSSHKGGKESLEQILQKANSKFSIAITPDGPTGPALKMKAGAVITAQRANIPLVLVGIHYVNKKQFRSWDSFEIPKPFSKVKVVYSDPIFISESLSREETTKIIEQCEQNLNQLNKKAEELC